VRFLLGGRHGEFKFLPPTGYAPCCEAVLPREKLKLEASQDETAAKDLLGPTVTLSQAAFTPTPVDTSQVETEGCFLNLEQQTSQKGGAGAPGNKYNLSVFVCLDCSPTSLAEN